MKALHANNGISDFTEKALRANNGITHYQDEDLSINCAVIDKSIVWYGNINFFGYNNSEANIMRLADTSVANEMMEVIYARSDSGE